MVAAASLPSVADVQPFTRLTFADHRKIYTRLERATKPLSETVKKETPAPLHLVVYALRFAVRPTVVHAQIPDMLKLLAHVEAARLNILSLAPGLLPSVTAAVVDDDTASTWIRILCAFCIYHTYHLCPSSISSLLATTLSSRPTLLGLSLTPADQKHLSATRTQCTLMLTSAQHTRKDHRQRRRHLDLPNTESVSMNLKEVRAFHAKLLTGGDEGEAAIMLLLEEYLNEVERAAEGL